jgi:sugar lactone lactonase YvrE
MSNVFSPDGMPLGHINPDEITANCAFGEDDCVLYITAHQHLCRIKTSIPAEGQGKSTVWRAFRQEPT